MSGAAFRTASGFDAHRLGGRPPLVLGGVVVDDALGVEAHSDGDVLSHAIADALLGAGALGDLGEHFPSDSATWRDVSSLSILAKCLELLEAAGWRPVFLDATVVSSSVRVAPHRTPIRTSLAGALGLDMASVSVKATSTDGMGFTGRDEGLAAHAVVTVWQPAA